MKILNIYLIVCNALAQSIYIFAKKFKASIMEPIVVSRKPCKCPKCGGKVVKIVYGEPCPELFEQAERKEVVLGGCCIHEDGDPQWACVECEQAFIKE